MSFNAVVAWRTSPLPATGESGVGGRGSYLVGIAPVLTVSSLRRCRHQLSPHKILTKILTTMSQSLPWGTNEFIGFTSKAGKRDCRPECG